MQRMQICSLTRPPGKYSISLASGAWKNTATRRTCALFRPGTRCLLPATRYPLHTTRYASKTLPFTIHSRSLASRTRPFNYCLGIIPSARQTLANVSTCFGISVSASVPASAWRHPQSIGPSHCHPKVKWRKLITATVPNFASPHPASKYHMSSEETREWPSPLITPLVTLLPYDISAWFLYSSNCSKSPTYVYTHIRNPMGALFQFKARHSQGN